MHSNVTNVWPKSVHTHGFIAVAALLVIIQNRGKRKGYREWSNKFYHILTGRTGGKV